MPASTSTAPTPSAPCASAPTSSELPSEVDVLDGTSDEALVDKLVDELLAAGVQVTVLTTAATDVSQIRYPDADELAGQALAQLLGLDATHLLTVYGEPVTLVLGSDDAAELLTVVETGGACPTPS